MGQPKLTAAEVLAAIAEMQPVTGTTLHTTRFGFVDRSALYHRLKQLAEAGQLVATVRIEGDTRGNYRRRHVYYSLTADAAPQADEPESHWTPGVWVHPIRARALGLRVGDKARGAA